MVWARDTITETENGFMEPKSYRVSEMIKTPLAHHDDGCRLGNLQKTTRQHGGCEGSKRWRIDSSDATEIQSQQSQGPKAMNGLNTANLASRKINLRPFFASWGGVALGGKRPLDSHDEFETSMTCKQRASREYILPCQS